jgi:hypothetical protein
VQHFQGGGYVQPGAEWAAAQQAGQYAGGSMPFGASTAGELPPAAHHAASCS